MDISTYTYNEKLWRPSVTVSDKDSFFHSTFGVRASEDDAYLDKKAKVRRMRWATFLTYFEDEPMPVSLVDILKKCWSSSDKYKDISFENKNHFENYITDVMKADHDVTMEEISILATLENVRIVLFSDREPGQATVINPDVRILGGYTNTEKPKEEVVLCLEGNTFSRLSPVGEDSLLKHDRNEYQTVEARCDEDSLEQVGSSWIKYKKGGSAGSEGVQYQVNLLTVFFLNAFRKLKSWKLSTENKEAGKFDDVVFECSEGATLLQAKHKQTKTKKVTFEDMISTNSKNDDFSLPKYFLSYEEVKSKFDLKNIIICTNASLDEKTMKFLNAQSVSPESLLHYEGCDCLFYSFNDEILPQLKANVRIYFEKNYQNKGVTESVITDENIRDFLRHLQFYPNYPPGNDIGKVAGQLLSPMKRSETLHSQISFLELHYKILNWFQQKNGVYLTEFYARAIFAEIWRDKRWQKLDDYNVAFRHNNINLQSLGRISLINGGGQYLLQEIKIYRTLQDDRMKVLHISPDDGIEVLKEVVKIFELPRYDTLVLIWSQITEESVIREVSDSLRKILNKHQHKKIILVAESNTPLLQLIGYNCGIINKSIAFEDLSGTTQENLLKNKNIVFQGKDVRLEELFIKHSEDYGKYLKPEVLEEIVKKERVLVGKPLLNLDECTRRLYINRKFMRQIEGSGEGEDVTFRGTTFSEDIIYEVTREMVLISDGAGTGKSTVFTNLAIGIKEKNPHLWVIKINLNDCTKCLRDLLGKNRKMVTVEDLLNSKETTMLRSQLEKSVFFIKGKIVLLLDGFDEISPNYTGLILGLLEQCHKEPNFGKIFVATRPYVVEEVKENLQVEAFVLEPFTEKNQVNFLTHYWAHNLNLEDVKRRKCERYAKELISKMSVWIKINQRVENHFAAIPLHVRMLAEIFQEGIRLEGSANWEGCQEYLVSEDAEPRLPENMNIKRLYEIFIKKKRSIFIDKGNPTGHPGANQALVHEFDECSSNLRYLALELILKESECKLFLCYQQCHGIMTQNVLKMGILQKINNKYHFIHRTFAEFFVAESLIKELQLQNQNAEFQRFLIENILVFPNYYTVRVFFDGFLRQAADNSSFRTFYEYQSTLYEVDVSCQFKFNFLHKVAREGHVAILQLVLKLLDPNSVTKIINYTELFNILLKEKKIKCNILNIVHSFIKRDGFDIVDTLENKTLLEYAAEGGHLEMVKFLVENGAKVNVSNWNKQYWQNNMILYTTITKNHKSVTAFLLDRILECCHLNINEQIIAYTAAYLGRLELLEELIEQGMDVNSEIDNGEPLLFGAVRGEQHEIIKYLVRQGSDINRKDYEGNTALLIFSKYSENVSVTITAELLIQLGINIDGKNRYGHTAQCIAVYRNHFSLVELLVNSGANVNLGLKNGSPALHMVVAKVHPNMVKFLLKHGANVNSRDGDGRTALHITSLCPDYENLDTIKFIIKNGGDVNIRDIRGRTPLHIAVATSVLNVVKILVDAGADVGVKDSGGCTALHCVAFRNSLVYDIDIYDDYPPRKYEKLYIHCPIYVKNFIASYALDIVEILVAKCNGIVNMKDEDGRTALHSAVLGDRSKLVGLLVEFNTDVNIKDNSGCTVLHLAAEKNQFDVVKLFIEHDANVNTQDNKGCTALHKSIRNGRLDTMSDDYNELHLVHCKGQSETAKLLVECGANIDLRDNKGHTALHLAALKGQLDTVKFLTKNRDRDMNVIDNNGRTSLHLAASKGQLEIVKLLVECGANVNIRDSKGNTALHLAVWECHFDTVMFFIMERNTDVDAVNNDGHTALHLAACDGQLEIFLLLVDYGANIDIKDRDGHVALYPIVSNDQLKALEFLMKYKVYVDVS